MLLECGGHEPLCHDGGKCVARHDNFTGNAVCVVLGTDKIGFHTRATALVQARSARDGACGGQLGVSANRAHASRHALASLVVFAFKHSSR